MSSKLLVYECLPPNGTTVLAALSLRLREHRRKGRRNNVGTRVWGGLPWRAALWEDCHEAPPYGRIAMTCCLMDRMRLLQIMNSKKSWIRSSQPMFSHWWNRKSLCPILHWGGIGSEQLLWVRWSRWKIISLRSLVGFPCSSTMILSLHWHIRYLHYNS